MMKYNKDDIILKIPVMFLTTASLVIKISASLDFLTAWILKVWMLEIEFWKIF